MLLDAFSELDVCYNAFAAGAAGLHPGPAMGELTALLRPSSCI